MDNNKASRRNFIKHSVLTVAGLGLAGSMKAAEQFSMSSAAGNFRIFPGEGEFSLPLLGYAENALEPHIDALTMQIHHGKHHAAYVSNLNKAIDAAPQLKGRSLDDLLRNVNQLPEDVRKAIRNNGGGHWNHSFFWQVMSPKAAESMPSDALRNAMISTWNDMDSFKTEFKKAALGLFGSGWAWVIKDAEGKLSISTTPNQDNPLMDVADKKGIPILGLDVWEHAYYLKNQNRRADYIDSFMQVIDWGFVSKQFGQ